MTILDRYYRTNKPGESFWAAAYSVKRFPAYHADDAVGTLNRFSIEELREASRKRYISKRILRYADELIQQEFLPLYNELKIRSL